MQRRRWATAHPVRRRRPAVRQSGPSTGPAHRHYLTGLGALLTAVYAVGLIFRPQRRIARMGIDSLAVLILYAVGISELIALAYACPADHVPVLDSPR